MLHTDLKVKHQTYVTTRIKNTRWPAVRNRNGTRTHQRLYIFLAYSSSCRIYSTSNAIYFTIDNIEIPVDASKGIN